MEKQLTAPEPLRENPKFLERFISFFRTRISGAVSSAMLPGTAAAVIGALVAGPVGAVVGGGIVSVPFLIGGHDFGHGIENNIYQRPKKTLSPWREKLKKLASSVSLKVNQTLENGIGWGTIIGSAAGIATMNPAIGVGAGIVGGVAAAVGGWRFGTTLQTNIENEQAPVSSAYQSIMAASGQSVGMNRGV